MSTIDSASVCFGEFVLRREALALERNGARIRLQIQQFRVLELLVERAGEVVSREELRARLWPSNVVVDFDHGLNNAITRLREALGDSASDPRYIETVPRVGYRFIHPVKPAEDPSGTGPVTGAATAPADRPRRAARFSIVGVALVAIASLVVVMVADRDGDHDGNEPIRSIAVLPITDLSEGGTQSHLAAGMTEALITRLAQDQSLRVVSLRGLTRDGDGEKTIAELSHDLQIDGVVDGSIVRRGGDVRVQVRLVRAADESYAWAQSYERSISDVFALQRELADDISNTINAGIGRQAIRHGAVARSDNIEAYDLYLHGRHLWNQRSPESVTRSLEYFQKAIQLDADFAAAHAGVAQSYAALGGQTLVRSMPPDTVRTPALTAARRSIELDSELAEAHVALANVLSHLFPRSAHTDIEIEREFVLALRLDAASATARHGYANFLSNRRRSEEAIAQYREALLLDPLSASVAGRLGQELVGNNLLDEGMQLIRRAVEIEPWQYNAQLRLGWAAAALGRFDEARNAFGIAEQISPNGLVALSGRSYVAALSGSMEEATAALAELQAQAAAADAPFFVAIVYVGLRDREGALKWLEKAAASSNVLGRGLYGVDGPVYDWLREDPRFDRIRQLVEASDRSPGS